jgi:transcriptional regulator with XRE-family HTH domain
MDRVVAMTNDGPADAPETGRLGPELSRLVRSWRERIDPASIPGLVRDGRRKSLVSQEDMARLIEVSSVWYGRLERGEQAGYSDDFLNRTAMALRLNDDERMLLYLYAVGHEPAPHGTRSTVVLTEPLKRVVHSQPWPAYISDESWDVVDYNRHMLDWFPWVGSGLENNVMRWVFTYPDAREQLYNWENDWAPLMLAQMRVANARQPDNMRLAQLIREILQDEYARRLWEKESMVYVHPDGDRRKLHLPYHHEVIDIELVALAPLRAANVRLMMLLPLDRNK